MKSHSNIPIQERMRVTLCLSFIGGFLETYTYCLHGGVFANAQTGNLVLLALSIMQKNGKAGYYLVSVCAFILGVFISESLCKKLSNKNKSSWLSVLVLVEAVILGIIPFLPTSPTNLVVNILVPLVCSLQFNGFQRTHGLVCNTVLCTANLRNASQHLYHALANRDFEKVRTSAKYFVMIGIFVIGASVSFATIHLIGKYSIWICSILLIIVHFILNPLKKGIESK